MEPIDEVDASALGYDAFCARYMVANRPVVLRNVAARWFPQAAQWTKAVEPKDGGKEARKELNYELLREKYGHATVPVVDGDVVEYGAEARSLMTFGEYLDLLEHKRAGKRYLKDWHFVHAFSQAELYSTPEFFQDDWLNWWWDNKDDSHDDYRFVYIGACIAQARWRLPTKLTAFLFVYCAGPAGSWTPLHHDVFQSYSWSVNVCGRKQWVFFHPDDEPKLLDAFGRFATPDMTSDNIDESKFPRVREATPMYVVQEAGDAIFVPSGWYHQVANLEDTMSINHNWFNGYNVQELWRFFQREYGAVEAELEHLKELGLHGKEFRDQCQVVMNANTGINYVEFQALLAAKESDLSARLAIDDEGFMSDAQREAMVEHVETTRGILRQLDEYFGSK